jgi:hypothetical protein
VITFGLQNEDEIRSALVLPVYLIVPILGYIGEILLADRVSRMEHFPDDAVSLRLGAPPTSSRASKHCLMCHEQYPWTHSNYTSPQQRLEPTNAQKGNFLRLETFPTGARPRCLFEVQERAIDTRNIDLQNFYASKNPETRWVGPNTSHVAYYMSLGSDPELFHAVETLL